MSIDVEAIVLEMQDALLSVGRPATSDDPGKTTAEWAALWGMHKKTAAERLNAIKAAGRLTVGTRHIECLDGKVRRIPVYAPKA